MIVTSGQFLVFPLKFNSDSEAETFAFAEKFVMYLKPGTRVGMLGNLGSGKTTLTCGLMRAMHVNDYITSPTYALVNEYKGTCPIYHMDLYRLNPNSDWEEIGLDHYMNENSICIIEWPEKCPDIIADRNYIIDLKSTGENSREIIVNKPL